MDGRVLLITGAAGGIGAATARMAVAEGYRVAVTSRSLSRLDGIVAELGAAALPLACDVTDWEQVRATVQRTREHFGRLDAVFANAGVSMPMSFLGDEDGEAGSAGADPAEWPEMVLANVCGPAFTARAALPVLREHGGHLLLTGSAAGRGVRPGNLYSATKWAVTGMAQSIRAECVGTGVRITLIQPGLVETGMTTQQPADKPKLDPADIAEAVRYALSQPSHVDVNEILVRPLGQHPYR